MLSRSNSNAGDRLRRAKSTSSTHTSSSGHQRTHTSIDPFITRQQAEVAAVEAYERARAHEEPTCPAYRPVPPKLQRRQSQVTGKTEGSHLEDARLGRRKSNSRKENASNPTPVRSQQHHHQNMIIDESSADGISIRRRYVVPPNPTNRVSQYDHASLPSSSRHPRRSEPGYADGSPIARNSSTLKDRSSTMQLRTPRAEHSDGYSGNFAHLSDFGRPEDFTTQTDGDILAMARDRCLQDFHQHKLRERKSFILAPFQKRRTTNLQKTNESNYDTKLPPFNYADECIPPPPPPPLAIPVASITVRSEKKSRNFSDSLRSRFKKVFRKVSRVPSGVPVQHIEAKHFHFSTHSPLPTPELGGEDDPFTTASERTSAAAPEVKIGSSSSRDSADGQSIAKSRVTSWTNSTVAGTWSTRNDAELEELVEEQGQLRRSDSLSTLRKASSFFGRPLKNRLLRSSKAELRSSEESTGLYSALQERIKPLDSASQSANSDDASLSTTPSALATLPSQQKAPSTMSTRSWWAAPTIRSVTPDPTAYKLDIPSPVTEVLSPDATEPCPARHKKQEDEQSVPTPRSRLQRRPAMKAPTPSKEQIARRIEKSKNRWQSPLDELSPPAPRSTRAAMMDDNPYELPSLSRALQQPLANSDLPHHAKIGEKASSTRQDVLSPSLYSRGTDGATPQPDTPVQQGDMMVTITGREVRSYSISPPKRTQREERPIQASSDWRRWLSNEMNGLNEPGTLEGFMLPKAVLKDPDPVDRNVLATKHHSGRQEDEDRPECEDASAGAYSTVTNGHNSHMNYKRSSLMNERYAMIETKRDSAAQSDRKDSKVSSRTESRQARSENLQPGRQSLVREGSLPSKEDTEPRSTVNREGPSKSRSVANFASAANGQCSPDAQYVDQSANDAGSGSNNLLLSTTTATKEPVRETTRAYKPKSAFDLRANYKNSNSEKARPIAVRHKLSNNENIYILEDTTLQNISAGPYASYQPAGTNTTTDANKENSPPSEANTLPVLSSSEWLAAGTNKKREVKKASGLQPACRSRSVSRHSPARTIVPSGGSSPGQRMVTNWLDGKRSKENSPAFV